MLDCHFYGVNPKGHHLTTVLFHLANTVLLFLVLKWMTGALWRRNWKSQSRGFFSAVWSESIQKIMGRTMPREKGAKLAPSA
jgi:hypothetical protein